MQIQSLFAVLALLWWSALCARVDARERRIPNSLVLFGAAGVALYLLIFRHTLTGELLSAGLAGFGVSLLFTLPGYALKRLGAGDVKMFAVIGAATGPLFVLHTILGAAAGLVAWALSAPSLWPKLSDRSKTSFAALAPPVRRAPYAPFMLMGMCCASLGVLI